MSTDKIVWLLDVDGVINANNPGWGAAPHKAYVEAHGTTWRFRWAPSLVDFIRQVALSDLVEIRWATTWVPWARNVEAAFKLPELALAFSEQVAFISPHTAKADAALEVIVKEQRPLLWTDDDAVPSEGYVRDALDQVEEGRLLIVEPHPNKGLQPEDVERIKEFFALHGVSL